MGSGRAVPERLAIIAVAASLREDAPSRDRRADVGLLLPDVVRVGISLRALAGGCLPRKDGEGLPGSQPTA